MHFFKVHATFAIFLLIAVSAAFSQKGTREIRLETAESIDIVNRSGRVAVQAFPRDEDGASSRLIADSDTYVSENDIRIKTADKRTTIVVSSDAARRIDLILRVPERTKVKIETTA